MEQINDDDKIYSFDLDEYRLFYKQIRCQSWASVCKVEKNRPSVLSLLTFPYTLWQWRSCLLRLLFRSCTWFAIASVRCGSRRALFLQTVTRRIQRYYTYQVWSSQWRFTEFSFFICFMRLTRKSNSSMIAWQLNEYRSLQRFLRKRDAAIAARRFGNAVRTRHSITSHSFHRLHNMSCRLTVWGFAFTKVPEWGHYYLLIIYYKIVHE